MRRCLSRTLVASILVLVSSISVSAGERYALIVSGASGGPPYLEQVPRDGPMSSRACCASV